MSSVLKLPREIANATKIPLLQWEDKIWLVRTANASFAALRAGGARPDANGNWFIERAPDVLLEPLDEFLPHFARRSLVPNVVDLIPETSWCSSLANLLMNVEWARVRDEVVAAAGGCEDCGARDKLECHESWEYDEGAGIQRLTGLRSLCDDCHETYHLGYATVVGRYSIAFARLVKMNRVTKAEEADLEEEIFAKFLRRSEIEWVLDLSFLKGDRLRLKKTYQQVAPDTLVGEGRMGEVQVSIVGLGIEQDVGRLALA